MDTLVFLSYARRQPDEGWADRVVQALVERLGLRTWVDKRGIRVGYAFDKEIDTALRSADAVVFLGSTSSLTSQYCRAECELALELQKPFVPLFIEPIDWTGFPDKFRRIHFEQIFRAADDDDMTAMVGTALRDAGLPVDPARIPTRKKLFDQWAGNIHPAYRQIRTAAEGVLRGFVDDCSTKLNLRPEQGYHNLNLALLLLRMGDTRRAQTHAELALKDLPGRADAYYFAALIAAAHEPAGSTPRARIEHIAQLADNAVALDTAGGVGAMTGATTALPWLLKAVIAHEYYARNGLIARFGTAEQMTGEARARRADADELDRLTDSLKGLSETSRGFIEALR